MRSVIIAISSMLAGGILVSLIMMLASSEPNNASSLKREYEIRNCVHWAQRSYLPIETAVKVCSEEFDKTHPQATQ